MISIIVAASENNVIGKNNQLIWHLPDDLKFFKKMTTGKVILMGRKTFESIGSRPLPNRINVVISRNTDFNTQGIVVFDDISKAVSAYKNEHDICIIGGEQIYRQSVMIADEIYLTRVHTIIEGDVFFPELNQKDWKLIHEEYHPKDEKHPYDFTFQRYIKN